MEQAQDGDVVLMHDLYETSVRGCAGSDRRAAGARTDKTYAFVTVSQLAAIHGITLEPGVVYNALSDEVAQQIADGSYSPTGLPKQKKSRTKRFGIFCLGNGEVIMED